MFNCRIGTEHEKFGFEIQTLRPMKYEQISELLYGISERFDWEKIMEGDYIIGLKQVLFLPEYVYWILKKCMLIVQLRFTLYGEITKNLGQGSKVYHWSLVVNLSSVAHLLKLCIKLVLKLIRTFTRSVDMRRLCTGLAYDGLIFDIVCAFKPIFLRRHFSTLQLPCDGWGLSWS